MKLGFFTMPIHPLEKDWRLSLREDREAFILADELGYTEGYVGEHHTDRAENITSSMMFICTLIEATRRRTPKCSAISMPTATRCSSNVLTRCWRSGKAIRLTTSRASTGTWRSR